MSFYIKIPQYNYLKRQSRKRGIIKFHCTYHRMEKNNKFIKNCDNILQIEHKTRFLVLNGVLRK